MNTVEKLEINTAPDHISAKQSDASARLISAEGNSHYNANINNAHLSQSANENSFKSLLGRFQFRHEPDLPRSHAAVDLILTILCFATIHFLYLGTLDLSSHRSIALFSALVLVCLSLYAGGMYSTKRLRRLNRELTNLVLCWAFAFAAIGLFAFLSKTGAEISRVWITLSMLLSLTSLIGIRILGSLGFMARKQSDGRNIVILGNSTGIDPLMRDLRKLSNSQINLAKVFNVSTEKDSDLLNDSAKQLTNFVESQRQSGAAIEQVWIAISENQSLVVEQVSAALINSSVDVCVVPDQYAERLLKGDVTRFGDTDIVNVSEISLSAAADQYKRIFDAFTASLALLILGIPMIIVAALIRLESAGPVLFRQKRYGVDGREIEILKFRSMHVHSDKEVQQATKHDARVTRVGKFIRKTSLDELPQLINVLNGTMSLVGPRPHAVSHNEMWRREIQGYMLRHKVRPGITGWAQVNGWRGETDTAFKMQQRVKYDLEYIRSWSPWLDLKILLLTVAVGFVHKNAY